MSSDNISSKKNIKKFNYRELAIKYAMYFALLVMIITLSISTDRFLTSANLISILRQISIQSIVAIGMTLIIIQGQIDLSVGSIVAFASIINAMLLKNGVPIIFAILLTILVSSIWGIISGIVTARYKVHSFLVTLAMMTAIRGLAYTISGGYPIGGLPDSFLAIGAGYLGPIPYPVIYMIIFYIVFIFILNSTPFGRAIYAVGGNAESARLSGINIDKVKVMVFTISAALSAVGGIILSSRLMSGAPDTGTGWEMDCITAAIIGGTNMFGGEGKLQGTLIGMLFVGVLANGMVLLGINPYMQQVIKGIVILTAVIMNSFQRD